MADGGEGAGVDFLTVQTPNGPVKFPATMTREQIAAALNASPPPMTWGQTLERAADTTGEAISGAASNVGDYVTRLIDKPGETLNKTGSALVTGGTAVAQQIINKLNPVNQLLETTHAVTNLLQPEAAAELAKHIKATTGSDITPTAKEIDHIIERYGSIDKFKQSLADHPIETSLDAVSILPAIRPVKLVKAVPGAVRAGKQFISLGEEATGRINRVLSDAERGHLTLDQLNTLRDRVVEGLPGWKAETADANLREAYRQLLFDEANITPTKGMVDGTVKSRNAEDAMRQGAEGDRAQSIMEHADTQRLEDLRNNRDKVRADISGSTDKIAPSDVGDRIGEKVRSAYAAADAKVDAAYKKAFDPTEQAAAGVAPAVDGKLIKDLPAQVRAKMIDGNQVIAVTKEGTPKAFQAQDILNDWAKTGRLPQEIFPGEVMPPPGATGSSWSSVEVMRKYLGSLRKQAEAAARSSNDWSDYGAINRVMTAFDEQFGKANSLLNDARAEHSAMMKTFHPAAKNAPAGLVDTMRKLLNPNNAGNTNFTTLFGEGKLTGGAQAPIYDHLKTIIGNDADAMKAMKEGVLNNLWFNPDGVSLTPQASVTALTKATGARRGSAYESLLSQDDLNALSRHRDLTETIADSQKVRNPPKTSYPLLNYAKELGKRIPGALMGAVVMGGAGHKFGVSPEIMALMSTAGLGGGHIAGGLYRDLAAARRAMGAITPAEESFPLSQAAAVGYLSRPSENFSRPVEPNVLPKARGGYLRSMS